MLDPKRNLDSMLDSALFLPHKGFLDLTECAHVHEFIKNLLTEFTVYLKIAFAATI